MTSIFTHMDPSVLEDHKASIGLLHAYVPHSWPYKVTSYDELFYMKPI